MNSEIKTVTTPIVAADGKLIQIGSVLRNIEDGVRGVVDLFGEAGIYTNISGMAIGDIAIKTSYGSHRVTNKYSQWRHIPHSEQSYQERYWSWLYRPFYHDEESAQARAEAVAISGIMTLLPEDAVNWEFGPYPDLIEDALSFLVDHLSRQPPQSNRTEKKESMSMIDEIETELDRARAKFPSSNHSMTALMEEVGELARAMLDEPWARVRAEAVQVAVMAMRVAEEGDPSHEAHRAASALAYPI